MKDWALSQAKPTELRQVDCIVAAGNPALFMSRNRGRILHSFSLPGIVQTDLAATNLHLPQLTTNLGITSQK